MKTSLSERLVIAMKKKNARQADLVRVTGVARPSVHGWISGTTKNLRGENLVKIASYLGVNTNWLAHGEGEMESYWPFKKVKPADLALLSEDSLEDIEDFILLKVAKVRQSAVLHSDCS